MRLKIQLIVERDEHEPDIEEVFCFQRKEMNMETLGLTLDEGKKILEGVQKVMVNQQINEFIDQENHCRNCGNENHKKDTKRIIVRTLFGRLDLESPRFYACPCQDSKTKSYSLLAEHLPERTAPELLYLQSKWASLFSFGMSVKLIEEVLPLKANITSTLRNTHKVAMRLENELGDEKHVYIDGCERNWENLPDPGPPLVVGIDGGYLHGRNSETRKAGSFEVIVGKSLQEDGPTKRFGFVQGHDEKSKRRLYETLKRQDFQMNQTITFLSDGGATVRELQMYMSPQAEHILDWFHITMRITVIKQMIKGIKEVEEFKDLESEIDRLKWYLWHGNVFRALQVVDGLEFDLESAQYDEDGNQQKQNKKLTKLVKAVSEFNVYIYSNQNFIPNYADRHHYGEPISSAFVESTVNEVISKRMKKKQQMRWTKRGAHLLLQVRTRTLDDELREVFERWYPSMKQDQEAA